MIPIFDGLRDVTLASVAARMILSVLCGGLIGMEREYKRRPAGFRTHILICLGAAMTTLTSQYLYLCMHYYTDMARLGAQVVAGIGFIGAGTIIVTRRQRVKGLTTAAGLWTAAIIGLACGTGYVECALFATAMVLLAELLLIKLEYRFARKLNDVNLYVEYKHSVCIETIIRSLKEQRVKMNGLEITRIAGDGDEHHYCAVLTVQVDRKKLDQELIKNLSAIDDVTEIEEL